MLYLSQRNPAWALDKIGASDILVGRYGCTLTCVSMLSDYFRCFKSPKEIAHNAAWFTKDGYVLWNALKFKSMRFVWRTSVIDHKRILEALSDPDKAVVFQVDGSHWVVGVRPTFLDRARTLFSGDYWIADPWDGKKRTLRSAYGKITGAAYFERK